MVRVRQIPIALICLALALTGAVGLARAQHEGTAGHCVPVAERGSRQFGCYVIATASIGPLPPGPVFWRIASYATIAQADADKGPRDTVVEAFGKVWRFSIDAGPKRPDGGQPVADIGPLPIDAGVTYSAQYMEATFQPGMRSRVHRHPGPEAWYTLSGSMCLETPDGQMVGRGGGDPVIVRGGPPMQLVAVGSEVRRSLALVLHDSAQPASIAVSDWTPRGLCGAK
jgi:quercetin dioxygenase-like cupin family protein